MTKARRRRTLVYLLLSAIGIATVILYSPAGNPIAQVNAAAALSPVLAVGTVLPGAILPGLVVTLVAVGFAIGAVIALRRRTTVAKVIGIVLCAVALYVAAGAAWIFSGGEAASVAAESSAPAMVRVLFLPAALVLRAIWLTIGWPTYLVPALLFGLGVLSVMYQSTRKRRAHALLLWSFGEGVLITVTISFLSGGGKPILAQYFDAFLPPGLGSAILIVSSVVSGFFLALYALKLRFTTLVRRLRRRASSGRVRSKQRSSKSAAPKRRSSRGAAADAAGKPGTTPEGPEPQEPKLVLTPPSLPAEDDAGSDSPASNEASATTESETPPSATPETVTPVPADELAARREEIDEATSAVGLSVAYVDRVENPTTILFRYRVPESATVKSVERRVDELLSELGDSCLDAEVRNRQLVLLVRREEPQLLEFTSGVDALRESRCALPLYLGRAVYGDDRVVDLAELPHLLVAGATGSGKSVFLHAAIRSMITGPNADRIRLVLCDPKRVEFAGFENHPSLACEVLDESSTIARALEALTRAMESRYRTLKEAGVRSISELTGKGTRMTYVVVIIDEVSDLFLSDDGPSAKRAVVRLAQKARAVGIHVILATQRPSTDVIDGLIKANFPARIAFRTASATDSRVILGVAGAERLAGKGDALYLAAGQGRPIRVQGAFLPAFPVP